MSVKDYKDWHSAAERLAKEISPEKLHHEVCVYLQGHLKEPWALACSGGVDSLAALFLIYGHFPGAREHLHVFHYNHKLRDESDDEAKFVRNCAETLGLKVHIAEHEGSLNNKSEAVLREYRHRFFREALESIGGKILLLGHQQDDIAETMLMRLARGSGVGGLAAPRPVRKFRDDVVYLRPLLSLPKEDLRKAMQEAGIPWREDVSNEAEDYFRNRVRNVVIKAWKSVAPTDLLKSVAHSRSLLQEDDEALDYWLRTLLPKFEKGEVLNVNPLEGKPRALYRRAVHDYLYLEGMGECLSLPAFNDFLGKVIEGRNLKVSIGEDFFLYHEKGNLWVEKRNPITTWNEVRLVPGSFLMLPDGMVIEARIVTLEQPLTDKIMNGEIDPAHEVYLSIDDEGAEFRVRLWMPGDRYRALGAPGRRKLQDMFTDKKIGPEERRKLPVFYEKERGIAWCPGLPIGEEFRISSGIKRALRLTFGAYCT